MEGLRRKRALQAKQAQVREAHNQRLEAAKAGSDGYWCPVPGCYRFFQSEFWLILHRDFPGQCPDAGRGAFSSSMHKLKSGESVVTPVPMSSRDMMVKMVARHAQEQQHLGAAPGLAALAPAAAAAEAERRAGGDSPGRDVGATIAAEALREVAPAAPQSRTSGRYTLLSGDSFTCTEGPNSSAQFRSGFAEKRTALRTGGAVRSAEQLKFLKWAYERGVKNKADKLSPKKAEELMKLHGTRAGAARFPGDEYWAATTSDEPVPTFRLSQLLEVRVQHHGPQLCRYHKGTTGSSSAAPERRGTTTTYR